MNLKGKINLNFDAILQKIQQREGEKKLGESVHILKEDDKLTFWRQKGRCYAIVGVPESVGPRANCGQPGAAFAWEAFLSSFLNMQSNAFLSGEQILLVGAVDVSDLENGSDDGKTSLELLRNACQEIDKRVHKVMVELLGHRYTPIVIGGGHNNAYPIIKAVSEHIASSINVINIDPHADLRALEGRHSGNGFSYAKAGQYLKNYFVLGLHENYNSEYILNQFEQEESLSYRCFLDISSMDKVIEEALAFCGTGGALGLELDMDAIAFMPSSAKSPCGFTMTEARKLIRGVASRRKLSYLHLPEAAPNEADVTEIKMVGKSLAYLVSDFIKGQESLV